MGIISDNLARAVAESEIDLTGFVWRGPSPVPIALASDPGDATRVAGRGPCVDESGGKPTPGGGRLDFVVRPVMPPALEERS